MRIRCRCVDRYIYIGSKSRFALYKTLPKKYEIFAIAGKRACYATSIHNQKCICKVFFFYLSTCATR